ncbi:MAG: hypothetical protein WKG00_05525 [Polyangiaceae bacterium]
MLDLKESTRGIRPSSSPRRERSLGTRGGTWKKVGRLAAFTLVASVCGAGLAMRSVYADAENAALGLGQELGKLDQVGTTRAIRLNNQEMHVVAVTEHEKYGDLLDKVEAACRDGSPAGGTLQELSPAARKNLPVDPAEARAAGVLRKDGNGEGVVACLLREEPEHSPGKAEIVSRLQRFAETGDLAAIGRLRYVYAQEIGPGQSHVVAAWTEGSFQVSALLPPKTGGDTPGSDSRVVPRPADSVRLLTADVEGVPYAVRLYDAAGAPEVFLAGYESSLLDNGWSKVEGSADPRARSYVRGPVDLMVVAGDHGARSMVSMVEMRPR